MHSDKGPWNDSEILKVDHHYLLVPFFFLSFFSVAVILIILYSLFSGVKALLTNSSTFRWFKMVNINAQRNLKLKALKRKQFQRMRPCPQRFQLLYEHPPLFLFPPYVDVFLKYKHVACLLSIFFLIQWLFFCIFFSSID